MKILDLKLFVLLSTLFSYSAVAGFLPVNGGRADQASYVTSAAGTTTLVATSNQMQTVEGTSTQTVKLPDATLLPVYWFYEITNNSTGSVTVKDNASATIATVASKQVGRFTLSARATAAGTWKISILAGLNDVGTIPGNAATADALSSNPTDCTAGQFAVGIAANGNLTCSTPSGSGDVMGAASSTDNALVRFDGTTGKTIQNSGATLDDAGVLTATEVVADLTGDLTGNVVGTVTGSLVGNADTASALASNPTDCAANTFSNAIAANGNLTCASIPNAATTATSSAGNSTIVARDGSGNFAASTITATLTGTASGNTTYTASQYGVVLSGAANAMSVLAPNASTALPLISGGASANPSWSVLGLTGGGTGQTTKAAAFDALQPMTTSGDIIYGGASGTGTRLAKGSNGDVLTLAAGIPSWAAASGGAKVARFTCGQGVPAANTVNLINFDATTFYDYGVPGIAGWSYAAGCARSTSSPKFGAGWMTCSGTGSLNDSSPETLITIATGAFTIDMWTQLADINESGMWGAGDGGAMDDGDMEFYWNNGDTSWKFVSKAGATTTTVSGSDAAVTTGAKYHLEVARSGSTVYIFRDGVLKGSGVSNNNLSLTTGGTKTMYFGWAPSVNERAGGASFDEIRISDVARHTSGFTPETVQYPITNTISKDPSTMISSVTGGGLPGACTVNFTGSFFTLEPVCTCSMISATLGEGGCQFTGNNTTSAATLNMRVNGATANASAYLSCQQ